MKYRINITGMHCFGCIHLIKISLKDIGFESVDVNMEKNQAEFESLQHIDKVDELLKEVFDDLDRYKYSNLTEIV